MSRILENLWLGSIDYIHDFEFLKENKITHIITLFDKNVSTAEMVILNIKQKLIKIYDNDAEPIGDHFESCVKFIDLALAGGGAVYVHCFAGISRSPTIVAAYLIKSHGMNDCDALDFIKTKRPEIDPNYGFRSALAAWASKHCTL
jgi:atypical dual specificity phosphatase